MATEPQTVQGNVFERNPIKTLLGVVIFAALAVEGVSFLALVVKGKTGPESYPYNRTLSGYQVFKSTPNFPQRTIRNEPDDPEAVLDEYGFLSDKPISLAKPEGTIRIFLMGGSALFGAGQAREYSTIHQYKNASGGMIYSYPLSIAGQLKRELEGRYPHIDFEVITAAAFERALHQSLLYYLETVSRFSPDYVINMDGYNDVPSLFTGTPYPYVERDIRKYSIMLNQFESNRWLKDNISTVRVLSLLRRRYLFKPIIGFEDKKHQVSELAIADDMPGAYTSRKSGYIEKSGRFLQVLNHYMAVLRADGVKGIFSLQPMLDRIVGNKPLSEIESKMASEFGLWHGGAEHQDDGSLILRYFFDDYLTQEMARQSEAAGFRYIDLGGEMQSLPAELEYYTDYCHLTEEGNRHVATVFAEAITTYGFLED